MKQFMYTVLSLLFITYSPLFSQSDQWSWGNYGDSTFFPISVYLQEIDDIDAYVDAGINVYSYFWEGLSDNILCELRAKNMHYIASWMKHKSWPENGVEPDMVARANIHDPLFIAWGHSDEPDNAQGGTSNCRDPQEVIDHYHVIKSFDTTGRHIFLNCGAGVARTDAYIRGNCSGKTDMYSQYFQACDIASFDIYPVAGPPSPIEKPNNDLWYVAEGVKNMREWTNNTKEGYWFFLECTAISGRGGGTDDHGNPIPRKPTPEQIWIEAWMGIVAGGTGIGWFPYTVAPLVHNHRALLEDPEMMTAVKRVNSAVHELAVAINSETMNDLVDVETLSSQPWETPKIEVDYLIKHVGDTLYILTSGGKGVAPNTATFTINTKDQSLIDSRVIAMYENREIEMTDNVFSQEYTGQEVHLFKIGGINKDMLSGLEPHPMAGNAIRLEQNYPNPFSKQTQIIYELDNAQSIELSVYDLFGKQVAILDRGQKSAGRYTLQLSTEGLASGTYLLHLKCSHEMITKKLSVL